MKASTSARTQYSGLGLIAEIGVPGEPQSSYSLRRIMTLKWWMHWGHAGLPRGAAISSSVFVKYQPAGSTSSAVSVSSPHSRHLMLVLMG